MAKKPGSKDKYLKALDSIINVLKDHEQILDKSIHELAMITEQIVDINVINGKIEKFAEEMQIMKKEVTNLTGCLSNLPEEAFLPAAIKEQEPQARATPAVSLAVVQGGPSLILHCKQWGDFEVLAMHAQMLSFNYNEDEKVFQVDALKGNQIIKYAGALPNFSIILKTWFSRQLDITEPNILEGFWDKPN